MPRKLEETKLFATLYSGKRAPRRARRRAKFCWSCGKPDPGKFCPSCGSRVADGIP